MSIEEMIAAAATKIGPTLPGFVGGVLSLRFFKEQTWGEKVMTVLGGWACASWATEPVLAFFTLNNTSWSNGISFFVGLFGMSIVAALMAALKEINLGEIVSGWIKRGG